MVYFCSYSNNHVFDVPIGGKIPDLDHIFPTGSELQWSKELAVSALHYTGESSSSSSTSTARRQTAILTVEPNPVCLYAGKCSCKEKKLRSMSDLCKTKHDYGEREAAFHLFKKHFIKSRIKRTLPGLSKHWTKVTFCGLFLSPMTVIKASVLSAHDKGSHAEVKVKVRKVLQSGQVALSLGTISIYPLSWTSRGCTCPILNPGETCLKHGSWYLYTSFLALKEQ